MMAAVCACIRSYHSSTASWNGIILYRTPPKNHFQTRRILVFLFVYFGATPKHGVAPVQKKVRLLRYKPRKPEYSAAFTFLSVYILDDGRRRAARPSPGAPLPVWRPKFSGKLRNFATRRDCLGPKAIRFGGLVREDVLKCI
jgi:hypothetical protein